MSIFTLHTTDRRARAGTLHTSHGDVPTPTFMPVATQGSVKAIDSADLRAMNATILLSNAYHLYLRPGVEVIEKLGGLHSFMGWQQPILTDSGGFQGFSLEHLRKVTEDAIIFKSHINGDTHMFSPEASINYQQQIGSDIMMPLDVCVPSSSEREIAYAAVARTGRWAIRSLKTYTKKDQALFGIVQGGMFPNLRELSALEITSLGFSGYAIGGLSVGESKSEMYKIAGLTSEMLPTNAPRYLLGVGSPEDLVKCVGLGIDMFDCVLPTRIARKGNLLVRNGRLNIRSAAFKKTEGPVEDGCDCYTCLNHTAAYIHHLFRAKELLAYRLATIHNLKFVLRLMDQLRSSIITGNFESYSIKFLERFAPTNEAKRQEQAKLWIKSRAEKKRHVHDR